MQATPEHLSDEELLLFSDQELPAQTAATARAHVAQCQMCRSRLTALETALADFIDFQEQAVQPIESRSAGPRSLLKARLTEAKAPIRETRNTIFGIGIGRQLASACLALLLVSGGSWAIRHSLQQRTTLDSARVEAVALPRRMLTPGSARPIPVADLCSSEDLQNDPPVDPSLEQAVFQEYGLSASAKGTYELDYLITPALGGAKDMQNLWPQPDSTTWNAHAKDQLEDHLHDLVCQGKVQLTTAQSEIATDWIAAYKRRFHTNAPLSNAASIIPKMAPKKPQTS